MRRTRSCACPGNVRIFPRTPAPKTTVRLWLTVRTKKFVIIRCGGRGPSAGIWLTRDRMWSAAPGLSAAAGSNFWTGPAIWKGGVLFIACRSVFLAATVFVRTLKAGAIARKTAESRCNKSYPAGGDVTARNTSSAARPVAPDSPSNSLTRVNSFFICMRFSGLPNIFMASCAIMFAVASC